MKTFTILTLIVLLDNNITCETTLKNNEMSKVLGSWSPWNCGCCYPDRNSFIMRIQYMCCYEIINQTIFASICADSNSMFYVQAGSCLTYCQDSAASSNSKCYEDVKNMPYTCIREGFRPPEVNNSLVIGIVSEKSQTSRLPTTPTLQAKLTQTELQRTSLNPFKLSSENVFLTTSNELQMTSDKTHTPSKAFADSYAEMTKFVSSAAITKTSLNTISQTKLLSTIISTKPPMLLSPDLTSQSTPNIQQLKTTPSSDKHISTYTHSFINTQTLDKAPNTTKFSMATMIDEAKIKTTSINGLYLYTLEKLPNITMASAVNTKSNPIITSSITPILTAAHDVISHTLTKPMLTKKPPNMLMTTLAPATESKSAAIITLSSNTSTNNIAPTWELLIYKKVSDTTIKSTPASTPIERKTKPNLTNPTSVPDETTRETLAKTQLQYKLLPITNVLSNRLSQPTPSKLLSSMPLANIHALTLVPKGTSAVPTKTWTSAHISSFIESSYVSYFSLKQEKASPSPRVSTTSPSPTATFKFITLNEILKTTKQNHIPLPSSTVMANLMDSTSSTTNNPTPNVRGIAASVSKSVETQSSSQANHVNEEMSFVKNSAFDKTTTQSLTTSQTLSSTAKNDYLTVVTGGICGTVVALVALITVIACIVRKKFKCTVLPNSRRFSTAEPFLQDLKYRMPRVSIDVPIEEVYGSNCRIEETYAA